MKLLRQKITVAFLASLLICNYAVAQDGGDDPDIPTIPLDGGLSILLVAGAAYGGKKIRDYRNKNKTKPF